MQFLIGLIAKSPLGMQALVSAAGVLLIACSGLGAAVWIQSARLDAAKTKLEACGNLLTAQNQAIDAWKAKGDEQAQRVKDAIAQGEQVQANTAELVRAITKAVIPKDCQAAIKWGATQALEINGHWEAAR